MSVRAVLVAALLALCLGLWAGGAWRSGRQAVAQQAQDKKTIKDLTDAAQALRQQATEQASAYAQASTRLNAIAQGLEEYRETNRQFEQQQRDALAALLAARPDVRDVRVGAELLRHWQQSNAGPAAAGTATASGQLAQPMPTASTASGRQSAHAVGQP